MYTVQRKYVMDTVLYKNHLTFLKGEFRIKIECFLHCEFIFKIWYHRSYSHDTHAQALRVQRERGAAHSREHHAQQRVTGVMRGDAAV